jgi:hypothetical protein
MLVSLWVLEERCTQFSRNGPPFGTLSRRTGCASLDYHRRARIRLPNAKVHAVLHAIVEAQIALADETPARRAAQRLMDEGLDRHEAIHAIGLVLAEFMQDLLKAPQLDTHPNVPYFAVLLQWLHRG